MGSDRHVPHFWYLVAILVEKGALKEQKVFEWFGPPDVIWVLEGLEGIQQNLKATSGAQKTRWPPLGLLRRYYESKGVAVEKLKDGTMPITRISLETVEQIKNL